MYYIQTGKCKDCGRVYHCMVTINTDRKLKSFKDAHVPCPNCRHKLKIELTELTQKVFRVGNKVTSFYVQCNGSDFITGTLDQININLQALLGAGFTGRVTISESNNGGYSRTLALHPFERKISVYEKKKK